MSSGPHGACGIMLTCKRKLLIAITLSTVTAGVATVVHALRVKRRSTTRQHQPKFHRSVPISPISSNSTTVWRQLLSFGGLSNFLVALNFDRNVFFKLFLSASTTVRFSDDSTYCNGVKLRGRKPPIETVNIIGLSLWYLKSFGHFYSLSSIFGFVQSRFLVWLSYGLEVLLRVI